MAAHLVALVAVAALSSGCRKDDAATMAPEGDRIVVQLGDSVLRERDVYSRIPAGITSADSLLLYDAIVQDWLEKRLLADVARLNLPAIERIEKMVEDYRMQLITNEYRRVMAESYGGEVSESDVKDYYDRHREELRLQWPLMKGVYVKIAAGAPHIDDIRRWLSSDDSGDIETLENYGLGSAVQYDDFRDTWVSWKALSELIPWRFGDNSDFLSEGYMFDKMIGSSVYMFRVDEVMRSGEVMPYTFARNEIIRILADRKRSSYDSDMLRRLYDDAVASKRLHPGGYVPAKFRNKKETPFDNNSLELKAVTK